LHESGGVVARWLASLAASNFGIARHSSSDFILSNTDHRFSALAKRLMSARSAAPPFRRSAARPLSRFPAFRYSNLSRQDRLAYELDSRLDFAPDKPLPPCG
jgi:hypothetical protein